MKPENAHDHHTETLSTTYFAGQISAKQSLK